MRISLYFSVFNNDQALKRTLDSILSQKPSFDVDICVVDDGSTDNTPSILAQCPVKVVTLPKKCHWRNPAVVFNHGLRQCREDIVIHTCSDVIQGQSDTLQRLVGSLTPGHYAQASIKNIRINQDQSYDQCPGEWWVTSQNRAPWPWLGAFWRKDLFAIGGWDERFTQYGGEDSWLIRCLEVRGVTPTWHDEVIAYHQQHWTGGRDNSQRESRALRDRLEREGRFCTETAPWNDNGTSSPHPIDTHLPPTSQQARREARWQSIGKRR